MKDVLENENLFGFLTCFIISMRYPNFAIEMLYQMIQRLLLLI
jgi:hypothetical protein